MAPPSPRSPQDGPGRATPSARAPRPRRRFVVRQGAFGAWEGWEVLDTAAGNRRVAFSTRKGRALAEARHRNQDARTADPVPPVPPVPPVTSEPQTRRPRNRERTDMTDRRAAALGRDDPLRVVVCRPGEPPRETVIPHTLEALQEVVGGYLEQISLPGGFLLICNEEGRLEGLPPNRTVPRETLGGVVPERIVGPCFVTATDSLDSAEFVSLTDVDLDMLGVLLAEDVERLEREAGR